LGAESTYRAEEPVRIERVSGCVGDVCLRHAGKAFGTQGSAMDIMLDA
jgi:hypothetical protein